MGRTKITIGCARCSFAAQIVADTQQEAEEFLARVMAEHQQTAHGGER